MGGRGATSFKGTRAELNTQRFSDESVGNRIDDILENGYVFDFGRGPYGTSIILKPHGWYSYSIWDAPIKMATREGILDKVENEAVAIVDKEQVNLRSNYFKRNGFEIVGTKDKNEYVTYVMIKRKKE